MSESEKSDVYRIVFAFKKQSTCICVLYDWLMSDHYLVLFFVLGHFFMIVLYNYRVTTRELLLCLHFFTLMQLLTVCQLSQL